MSKDTRAISWIKAAHKEFGKFPKGAQTIILRALTIAAEGSKADIAKPMKGLGSGVIEVALAYRSDAYRTVYAVTLGGGYLGCPCIPEKILPGYQDTEERNRSDPLAGQPVKGAVTMTKKLETVKGSGNVFRDFGYQNADVEQLKSQLAAEIIRILDKQKLSVRKAAEKTGFDHADFSRIRNADLGRFTIDRLVTVLNRLNQHVEIKVTPFRGRRLKTA